LHEKHGNAEQGKFKKGTGLDSFHGFFKVGRTNFSIKYRYKKTTRKWFL
jgi:hypothetical protein